jgi:hypothetical protein
VANSIISISKNGEKISLKITKLSWFLSFSGKKKKKRLNSENAPSPFLKKYF